MPHIQTIPEKQIHWEHVQFIGRRIGDPSDQGTPEEALRNWGVHYMAFNSEEDAKWLRDPILGTFSHFLLRGELVDRFFYDGTEYQMSNARVASAIAWALSANPTQAELDKTENLKEIRAKMAGAPLFAGTPAEFTVTELPAERASE